MELARSVAVSANYAYVAAYGNGLVILDLSPLRLRALGWDKAQGSRLSIRGTAGMKVQLQWTSD